MSGTFGGDRLKLIEHLPVAIRSAKLTDKNLIEVVYRKSTGTKLRLDELEWHRWIDNKGLLVAEMDGCVVGFGGIDVSAREQLKWLFLIPEYQGRGIGSILLKKLEAVGWSCGLQSILLHSTPRSEMFYRKAGYIPIPIPQIDHDHDGIEMVKMRCDEVVQY
jgi:GNAT superfamily N-acetyltransferase